MNQRYVFSDTASGTLTHTGNVTVDADFDAESAETVTLDTQWEQFFDTDEYVQFEATVAQPIVQPYFHDGELQKFKKDEQELRTAQAQIDNLPWTMGHPERNRVTSSEQIRGFWADPRWNDGQTATLNIPANDTDAVRFAVQNDNVSIGFSGTLDWVDDADNEFDAVQRDYAYDHIASVENGRCPPEKGCQLHVGDELHGHATDGVATKLTEEDGMHGEMNPKYSVGDWVQWNWSDGTATGRVDTVQTEESVMSSGARLDPQEEEEPVYGIDHWVGDSQSESTTETTSNGSREDESSNEFGNYKVAKESDLSSTSEPEDFTDSGCAPTCSVGPCSCGAHDPFIDVTSSQGEDVATDVSLRETTDVSVNGADIDLVPPEAAQTAAQQALDAREDDDVEVNGMTSHGWDRAEQLVSGEELTPSDIVGSRGAMAPWWSRHEQYSISGESLKEPESDNPWEDNSYTSGKGWGGYAGYQWALSKGNEIKRARGEGPVYGDKLDLPEFTNGDIVEHRYMDLRGVVAHNPEAPYVMVDPMVNGERNKTTMTFGNTDLELVERRQEMMDSQHTPDGLYVEDGDWYGVAPSETSDGEPKYELNNCNDSKDAYNLRNNGDYEIGTDTLITRIKRAADAHDCPPEQKPWLEDTNDSFNDTMTIQEFVDENDLSAEDVRYILDSADVDTSEVVDAPEQPTDFYDGEPDVEALADDFDAVGLLVEQKETLEAEVDSLEEDLRESKHPVFADKAEHLAGLTQRWGDEEELMDKFDAEDEDERWTVDTIEDKIELVEDITGTETTTVTDSSSESEDEGESLVDSGSSMQIADRDSIETTDSGKYNLSSVRGN